MSYLKILEIADVDEDSVAGQFTRRVNVVEVLDSRATLGSQCLDLIPWDELVVVQETTWSESNVYAVGETISGTSATFTGGTGNETYRWRFSISLQQIVIGLTQHGLII